MTNPAPNETTNGAATVAAPALGPLQMEQGYLSTVARSEQFSDDPAVRFYWGRVEAAANGSDPNLTERYRQLFLAAPELLAACEDALNDLTTLLPGDEIAAIYQCRRALALANGEGSAAR